MSRALFYAALPAFLVGIECAAFGAASAWAIGELLHAPPLVTRILEIVAVLLATATTVWIFRRAYAFERERLATARAPSTVRPPPIAA